LEVSDRETLYIRACYLADGFFTDALVSARRRLLVICFFGLTDGLPNRPYITRRAILQGMLGDKLWLLPLSLTFIAPLRPSFSLQRLTPRKYTVIIVNLILFREQLGLIYMMSPRFCHGNQWLANLPGIDALKFGEFKNQNNTLLATGAIVCGLSLF